MTNSLESRKVAQGCAGVPLLQDSVAAGFPSPAEGHIDKPLDLNELCIQRPAATFFVRVQGESMRDAGILSGDVLVVDRSVAASHGDFVIASVDGEMTVKELHLLPEPIRLLPHNPDFTPIVMTEGMELEVFGVVTSVVRKLRS